MFSFINDKTEKLFNKNNSSPRTETEQITLDSFQLKYSGPLVLKTKIEVRFTHFVRSACRLAALYIESWLLVNQLYFTL